MLCPRQIAPLVLDFVEFTNKFSSIFVFDDYMKKGVEVSELVPSHWRFLWVLRPRPKYAAF